MQNLFSFVLKAFLSKVIVKSPSKFRTKRIISTECANILLNQKPTATVPLFEFIT